MSDITKKFQYWSYYRQRLGKRGTDIEQVLKDIIGVYSSHPSAPLSLYTRVKSFNEQAFYQLEERKLAIRIPAMRLTVHMLPLNTVHLAFRATVPPASDPVWQKRYSQKGRYIADEDYQNWKEKIDQLADKPLTATEIKKTINIPDNSIKLVLNRMTYEGNLLRIGAKSLRSNIISYVSTKAWMGESIANVERDNALTWLAGEYLKAFGPVRIKDFQWWTGISAGQSQEAFAAHETIQIDNDYLLLAKDLNDFESFKDPASDSVAILPRWDSYTMGYAPDGRERFVSKDMQHHIYGSIGATGGNALGVVLVNGRVYGSWDYRFSGNQMTVNLNIFEKPSSKLNNDITNHFNEISALLKAKSIAMDKKVT